MKVLRVLRILLPIVFMVSILTCKERVTDNPFDTGCPKDIFSPSNFTAEQQGNSVNLTWEQVNKQISGLIIKRSENDGTLSEVAKVEKTIITWTDSNVSGGIKYSYQLTAYAGSNLSNPLGATVTTQVNIAIVTTVTTAASITATSAVLGGEVTNDGGGTITDRGICYSTNQNPTTANSKLSIGTGKGTFSNTVTGFIPATIYYVRAYAINSAGTAYGAQITFTTAALSLATISTSAVTNIGATTALLGGNITSDGYSAVTERGVCFWKSPNPTISDSRLIIGSGTGTFSAGATILSPVTTYYARAYAVNGIGTAYGAQVTFTTLALLLPTVTTNAATSVGPASAVLGGNITSDGNATVSERGICYSLTQNPTTSDTKLVIGSGTGGFSNTVSGLTELTTYYAKAYAINSQGTAYGAQITFTTTQVGMAVITTTAAASIGTTSAILGGNVTSDGNSTVTERGICYSTSPGPTTGNSKVANGSGTGTFSATVTGLINNTTYYVRAYAINSFGTAYGNETSFKTSIVVSLATLTTTAPSGFTINSAIVGGNVTSDGNATVTERGICYATSSSPTTSNTKLVIGTGTGTFSSTITGLLTNTTYYVRAYAINSQGTAYGNEVNFKIAIATLTTTAANSVTMSGAILGGEVTNEGNSTVTERGICYATTQTPTISNTKVTIGSGIGIFSSTVTGLVANTTYYVRAYAINAVGTAYGNQVSFLTLAAIALPTLTTTAANNIAQTTATSGGNITSDGGGAVTARGVCFSINQNPTISDSYTVDGTGTGQFTSQLTNLLPGTAYYVRAYATNSTGTAYGAQVTFTSLKALPVLTTKNITDISAMGCLTGGVISSTGGGTISAKGICFSELTNPSLTDNVVTSGTGPAPFNSAIVSAVPGTTYYVRAYATNEVGTSYGDQKTFTALSNVNFYGFETGMLPAGWGGVWTVTSAKAFQSSYSLMSISDVASDATLTVTIANAGQISFYYSITNTYWGGSVIDFFIDNVKVGSFPAGSTGWNQGLFDVTAGAHVFKWHTNNGTGYIDYVVFPK
jgi:hypothetical protein